MKYPTPRTILKYLASHGPSIVQAEAIQMLARTDLPERWPTYQRGSRESLLRRLAANSKKSSKVRLEALRELLSITQAKDKPTREEIDRVLRECAVELGMSLDPNTPTITIAKPGVPNPTPSVVTERALELQPVAPSVPENGVPCEAIASTDGRISDGHAPARDPKQQSRDDLLAQGRKLEAIVLAQTDRCYRAPHNKQEAARLDALKAKWLSFEREALAAGIDVKKEFGDKLPWLRPVPSRIVDERSYRVQRRTLTIDEQLAITAQLAEAQRTHEDSGFWGGIPKAC